MIERSALESGASATGRIHPMPFTRIELVIMSIVDGGLSVLLGKRAGAPHKGKWALAGGVVRIDMDRDLDSAVQRVAIERLQTPLRFMRQLCVVGSAKRDPRSAWAVSIVYRALLPHDAIAPEAGKRIETLRWCPVDDAMADKALAFDHRDLIVQAVDATRAEIERLELPFGFLPEPFTLGELQDTCASILGRPLDKSSFRRRLDAANLLEPVQGEMRTGAFRPAQLYRKSSSN
jgi:8-oxo-dGTP diphosphatase